MTHHPVAPLSAALICFAAASTIFAASKNTEFIHPPKPDVQPALRSIDISHVTGAVIDESVVQTTLHVDTSATSGIGEHGSEGKPFATFAAAFAKATKLLKAGTPVRIKLAEGVYREGDFDIRFPDDEVARKTTLIIEGAGPGKTIFSGADVVTTKWRDEGNGLFSTDWPHNFGFYAGLMGRHNVKGLLGQRREMLFANGQWLHPVILENHTYAFRPGKAKLKVGQHGQTPGAIKDKRGYWAYTGFRDPKHALWEGSFGIAEKDENGNRLYVKLPYGVHPAGQRIEASLRKQFARIAYKDNVILRDFTVQHYAPHFFAWEGWQRHGTLQIGHPGKKPFFQLRNVLIEDVEVAWNSGGGFRLGKAQGLTLRRVYSHHNGTGGGGLGTVVNLRFENVTANFNNWRGVLGNKRGWAIAGTKTHMFRDAVFEDFTAIGNETGGLWMDINCENFLVDRAVCIDNTGFAMFFEISKGPMEARNSLFASNSRTAGKLLCAEHVTLKNNIFHGGDRSDERAVVIDENIYRKVNNIAAALDYHFYNRDSRKGNAQWDVFGTELFGRPKTHNDYWLPGPVYAEGNVFIAGQNRYAMLARLWLPPEIRRAALFEGSWEGRGNTYFSDRGEKAFAFVNFDAPEGSPKRLQELTLGQWSARFGETNSTFQHPRLMAPDNYDFRLHPTSPLVNRVHELPSVKLSRETIAALREWRRFVAGLRPHEQASTR